MWSIGVVCYILVSGHVPFMGKTKEETLHLIKQGKIKWPKNTANLSKSCKDFISSLLCVDISKRLDCSEALNHEWISEKHKASNDCFGDAYLQQIELFSTANKLQKILLNAVFTEMNKKEKQKLLKTLRGLDKDGNGCLNKNDIINHILINGHMIGNELELKEQRIINEYDQEYDVLIDDMLTEILQNEQNNQDSENDDDDLKFNEHQDEENEIEPLPPYNQMVKKISVPRFCELMEHSEKEYDIQALIESLAPTPSGHIQLSSINTFNGVIRTRDSICKMMDDMVDNIAKEYFSDDYFIEID